MVKPVFITGNQYKADFLTKFLGFPVDNYLMGLDEIHSLDYRKITQHKAQQAFYDLKTPVLVENVGLSFKALGERLPGTLIKWLIDAWGYEGLCRMLDNYDNRNALAEICFAYYDGKVMKFFEGNIGGLVPDSPSGTGKLAFGWNPIFIPEGANKTYAQMNEAETQKFSLHTTTIYPRVREFLQSLVDK